MSFHLTENEKKLLRSVVGAIRAKNLKEEFIVVWGTNGTVVSFKNNEGWLPFPDITKPALAALEKQELIRVRKDTGAGGVYVDHVSVTKNGYDAVDAKFLEKRRPDMERIRIYLMAAALVASAIAYFYHLYG
jgi:hypothetical protein